MESKVSQTSKQKVVKTSVLKVPKSKTSTLTVSVFDVNGRSAGTITLNKEFFGQKVNRALLAQAIRAYETNRNTHWASTKTRSEVRGGGRKPWKQKGTGRARSGSTRSPLWVGGGVALGPKPRKVKLSLPKKMKQKALIIALSASVPKVKVISNLEKIQAKTKNVVILLKKLEVKKRPLIVATGDINSVKLASRNITGLTLDTVQNLNTYEIIKSSDILFSKEALEKLYEIRK